MGQSSEEMEVPRTLPTVVHLRLGDRLPGHPSIIEGCGKVRRQDLWLLIAAAAEIAVERTARPAGRRLKVHLASEVSWSTGGGGGVVRDVR